MVVSAKTPTFLHPSIYFSLSTYFSFSPTPLLSTPTRVRKLAMALINTACTEEGLVVSVSCNYIWVDEADYEHLAYVEALELLEGKLVAKCRTWISSTSRWEKNMSQAPEPHALSYIFSQETIYVPLESFVEAADMVHASEYRKIPEPLRAKVLFFSHADNAQGAAKIVSSSQIPILPNAMTYKRIIGTALRAQLRTFLKKRKPFDRQARLSFPLTKEEALVVLKHFFSTTQKGKMVRGVLELPGDLDQLCGEAWDVEVWRDGFYTCITGLRFSVNKDHHFNFFCRIAVLPGFKPEYRSLSNDIFKQNSQ